MSDIVGELRVLRNGTFLGFFLFEKYKKMLHPNFKIFEGFGKQIDFSIFVGFLLSYFMFFLTFLPLLLTAFSLLLILLS